MAVKSCACCGRGEADRGTIHELAWADADDPTSEIRLCEPCLTTRESKRWRPEDPRTRDLVEALAKRDLPKGGRYAFLAEEDEEVRLVRLRSSWIERSVGP